MPNVYHCVIMLVKQVLVFSLMLSSALVTSIFASSSEINKETLHIKALSKICCCHLEKQILWVGQSAIDPNDTISQINCLFFFKDGKNYINLNLKY